MSQPLPDQYSADPEARSQQSWTLTKVRAHIIFAAKTDLVDLQTRNPDRGRASPRWPRRAGETVAPGPFWCRQRRAGRRARLRPLKVRTTARRSRGTPTKPSFSQEDPHGGRHQTVIYTKGRR